VKEGNQNCNMNRNAAKTMRAKTRTVLMTMATTKTATGNQLLKSYNQLAFCFESESAVLATAQLETVQARAKWRKQETNNN